MIIGKGYDLWDTMDEDSGTRMTLNGNCMDAWRWLSNLLVGKVCLWHSFASFCDIFRHV